MAEPGAAATLAGFYRLMLETRDIRRVVVAECLAGRGCQPDHAAALRAVRADLLALPRSGTGYRVAAAGGRQLVLDLTYELRELERDLCFMEQGEDALLEMLAADNPDFAEAVGRGVEFLAGRRFNLFVTDRDGTVNNYCARYNSSVQSAYNAVFLARFARCCTVNAVILTSAALNNVGLLDMSVVPQGIFIHAGSKGREYCGRDGLRRNLSVPANQQARLDELNRRLRALVVRPEYEIFSLIGSGLQCKFGQTVIARQDMAGSIDAEESAAFARLIGKLVAALDPGGEYFRIEDTGTDLEIILTVAGEAGGGARRDFDKGDGLLYLDAELYLQLECGPNLVCGDTGSDVPMARVAAERCADTQAIFVTTGEKLVQQVMAGCPRALSLAAPDILLTVLNHQAQRSRT